MNAAVDIVSVASLELSDAFWQYSWTFR